MKLFDKFKEIKGKLDNYDNLGKQIEELQSKIKKQKEYPHETIYRLELAVEKRQHEVTRLEQQVEKLKQENSNLKMNVSDFKNDKAFETGDPQWL